MTRRLARNIEPVMLVLWLLETSAGSLAFYWLMRDRPFQYPHDGMPVPVDAAAAVDALVLGVTVGLVGVATGLYRSDVVAKTRRLMLKAAVSAAISLPAVWLVAKAADIDLSNMAGGVSTTMLLAWVLLLFATRSVYRGALRMDLFVRRIAVLGPPQAVARTIDAISGTGGARYRVAPLATAAGDAPASPGKTALPEGLWGVVTVGNAASVDVPDGVRHFDGETFWAEHLGRIDIAAAGGPGDGGAAFHARGAAVAPAAVSAAEACMRRACDIAGALFLILLTAPVLLVTALLIRIESPGPVIYRQERVGLGGRVFTLLKFRSMCNDAERLGPSWAVVSDPRVTVVGRVIRLLRIDELPQLFNILRGEMSLVGPRPERPHFVEQLAREIPLYRQRSLVKPGLTGWAQVSYPYGASVADARAKLSYDLYYLKHRSLPFDFLILLSTIRVILFQEGAR